MRPLHEVLRSLRLETLSPSPSGPLNTHLHLTIGPGHNLRDDFIAQMMSWEICSALYSFTSHPWLSSFPEQRAGPLPHLTFDPIPSSAPKALDLAVESISHMRPNVFFSPNSIQIHLFTLDLSIVATLIIIIQTLNPNGALATSFCARSDF